MARYTGPKDRLSRREGVDLFGKGTKLTRLNVFPGQHGPKGKMRADSQFGKQLREKQKVKRMYGLMEKQFRKYMEKALATRGNTVEALFELLETRLDNVVYRLGLAKTRPQARQLVGHRHITVNGEVVSIPSYHVQVGDTVALGKKTDSIPGLKELIAEKDHVIPEWLEKKATIGKIARLPRREDITEPISEQDIIEFYSR